VSDQAQSIERCVYCGCTRENPCRKSRTITCGWFTYREDGERICDNRECIEKEIERLWAQVEERQRKAEECVGG
jgi:hypothetical protein